MRSWLGELQRHSCHAAVGLSPSWIWFVKTLLAHEYHRITVKIDLQVAQPFSCG